MEISKRGIDLIIGSEGKYKLMPDGRYKAYLDTLAKPPVATIYCGLTKGVTMDMVITADEGDKMFAKELAVYEDAISRLVTVPLNQNQFDSLTSFVYNCGPGALQNSTLLKVLNQGNYAQVPAQLMRWTHAGGKEYPGLVTRRKAEGALFMEPMPEDHEAARPVPTEDVPDPAPQMPQRVEEKPVTPAHQAITQSWTIKGAMAALGGSLLQAYNWLTSTAVDTTKEALSITSTIDPYSSLFASLKSAAPLIAIGAVGIGALIVIMRRITAAREGHG